MISPINEASAATLDWKPAVLQPVNIDPDLPRSIPTPATETAPKGRIIDDSARGTIFWEADTDSGDDEPTTTTTTLDHEPLPSEPQNEETSDPKEDPPNQQPYGHPFRIQWLSTARLPFYRTRGLRNAWNSNREVKIARDGTELETGVGRRLINMFGSSSITQPLPGTDQRFPPPPLSPGNIPGQETMNLPPRHYQHQRY